jgi:hypothetical protein
MSQEDPIAIIIIFAGSSYLLKLWLQDYQAFTHKRKNARALPGASPAAQPLIFIGVAGALLILALETGGEYAFHISSEQSDINWLYLLAMISAAFVEEIIFRGYCVITRHGKAVLILSILSFSFLFAVLHPFLWSWEEGRLQVHLTLKAQFSTAIVFLNALWFYALRFCPQNTTQSLVPCIAAHLSSNLGVFIIKLLQGHVTSFY